MEVITKPIMKCKSNTSIRVIVPYTYLNEVGIELGDRITIKPNTAGYFLIQKVTGSVDSSQFNARINRYSDFHLPHELMHKYRITENHDVQFLISKGKLIFSFNKAKSE